MAERKFDPDAIARYRDFLLYWLEDVLDADDGPVHSMQEGALKKAPAFGTTIEGQNATATYGESHRTTWSNLQALRQSLFGIVQSLNKALESHETSEDYNVDDFKTQYEEFQSSGSASGNTDDSGGSTASDYENQLI